MFFGDCPSAIGANFFDRGWSDLSCADLPEMVQPVPIGNVQINYQPNGSGGGIKAVTEGTADFGASDMPMTDDQLKAFKDKNKYGVLLFPTVLGAAVPTYNLPGVTEKLSFTPEVLAGIFLGEIKTWNDPKIAKANPKVKLPDDKIVVVHRSDGSGTTPKWERTPPSIGL